MQGIVAERRAVGRARTGTRGRVPRALAACSLALVLSGCYLVQAASGQVDLLARSRPVASVLADPATPDATRRRVELAREAREFAIVELGLPDGRSFRRFAEIDRPYAVWNVVATPEFSLQPRRWCFPIAGCVTYRGYFDERSAQSFAWRLAARGDDTTVGGVATYSTLGHLPDPLLSTMLGWSEARFVGTIFHELAHERLYVRGDSAFNEAFASVVEDAGVRRWFAARGDAAGLAAWELARRREREFTSLLRGARAALAQLYASQAPPAEMRIDKNRAFGRLKFDYRRLRAGWDGYAGYDAWFARPLNNARLASVATYHDCVPGLERELAAAGALPAFYSRAEALARLPRAERQTAVCAQPPGE